MLDNSAFSQSEDTFRAGAKAWSSCYPNWNDDADLNGDGVVDVEDVKLIWVCWKFKLRIGSLYFIRIKPKTQYNSNNFW